MVGREVHENALARNRFTLVFMVFEISWWSNEGDFGTWEVENLLIERFIYP